MIVPDSVKQRFVERFKDRLTKEAQVYVSPELTPLWVKDAKGKYIIDYRTLDSNAISSDQNKPAFLFFVDFEPEANWVHRCAYAFVSIDGLWTGWYDAEWPPELIWYDAEWPPKSTNLLHPVDLS